MPGELNRVFATDYPTPKCKLIAVALATHGASETAPARLTQRRVAELCQIDPATVRRCYRLMERLGFIVRKRNPRTGAGSVWLRFPNDEATWA